MIVGQVLSLIIKKRLFMIVILPKGVRNICDQILNKFFLSPILSVIFGSSVMLYVLNIKLSTKRDKLSGNYYIEVLANCCFTVHPYLNFSNRMKFLHYIHVRSLPQ